MDPVNDAIQAVKIAAVKLAAAELDDNVAGRLTFDGSAELDYRQDEFADALAAYVAALGHTTPQS